MPAPHSADFLFVINPGSGTQNTDWPAVIEEYFKNRPEKIAFFQLSNPVNPSALEEKINSVNPATVVAIGGDGTIRLVADGLNGKQIALGVVPAGSANGLAKELGIPETPDAALEVLTEGQRKKIHVTIVNGHRCIHLSDIGFNAYLIKTFDAQKGRGMWGYFKAAVKILFRHPVMQVELKVDGKQVPVDAAMVVVANGTRYGSGAVINPLGNISDELFEVVAVKKISATELFKMRFSHADFDPEKTEIFQTRELHIRSKRKVHFQVDGEYLGKVYEIKATILPDALTILVPAAADNTLQ